MMLNDASHLFRRMWAAEAWSEMSDGEPACWERSRATPFSHQSAATYFNDLVSGVHCNTNWYEGNQGELGYGGRLPYFSQNAPALLGFDESITWYCDRQNPNRTKYTGHAEACVAGNLNILSLYSGRVPYNICRNLEWQACAAQGRVPGQGNHDILFARAPNSLDASGAGGKPLGQCRGWVPSTRPTGGRDYGYSTDDIFYLEVCMFNRICRNGHALFNLRIGEPFLCDFYEAGVRSLQA